MKQDTQDVQGSCLALIVAIVLAPILSVWSAYALLFNYNLFLVPSGAPRLTLLPFVGVSLMFAQLVSGLSKSKDGKDKTAMEKLGGVVATAVITPAVMIFIGWLYQLTIAGWMGIR